jgi:cytochrome P450
VTAESPEIMERIPADFLSDPYGLFERLRSGARACRVVMPHGAKVWIVTRYEDVRMLLTDPRISKDGRRMDEMYVRHSGAAAGDSESVTTGFDEVLSSHMLNADPPLHTRLRAPLSKAFTPSAIRRLTPRIEHVVDGLLDAMEGTSTVDLVRAFAAPLPLIMICDIFGIPEADRHDIERWSTRLIGSGHPADEVAEAGRRFTEYTNAIIEARRAHPGDDLISDLLRVGEDDPARLSHDEMVANIFVVLAAGLDTPMRQLGVAVYTLLTHPDALAELRADLSLIPAAVDELMRFDGTVATSSFRFAATDITLGDVTIPAGEMVLLSLASANRDSAYFADPDQLDLHRDQVGSLSLGHGYHYCIGAHLAKRELEVGLARLITRYPDLRLAVEPRELRWESGNLLRCLIELPVLLTAEDRPSEPAGRDGTQSP